MILVEHMSELFPPCECSKVDLILQWELDLEEEEDNVEFQLKRELPDESIHLGWTAWDELSNLIEALADSSKQFLLSDISA